jgi:hypothetical protein
VSGVVAGLIGSVKAASGGGLPVNIVTNPSFTVNLSGWESFGNSSRDTANFKSTPASLFTFYDAENDIFPYAIYQQSLALMIGQRYSLSFWIKNEFIARTFRIDFAGSSTTTATVPALSSWQYLKFENVLASSTTLNIGIYGSTNGQVEFNIDDVSVVLGATALP